MKQATKILESSNGCLDRILPVMDSVLRHFETVRSTYKNDPIIAPILQSGWSKFVDYYCLTDELYTYIIALILNPRRKWNYIYKHWPQEQYENAKNLVLKVQEEYKLTDSMIQDPLPSSYNDFWLELDAEELIEQALANEYSQYC